MMAFVTFACFFVVAVSCVAFLLNERVFVRLPLAHDGQVESVSILIPARNEAHGIADCLNAVLKSSGVELEAIVLDDHSSDATGSIVHSLASADDRIRLVKGELLPDGWCGKQFACWQLAQAAKFDALLFIDADVRLEPDAAVRAVSEAGLRDVAILSGFPSQITGTLGEQLLVPIMYLVLLTYLPFVLMRRTGMPAASAGCGQFMLCQRKAYFHAGGHDAIKASMHDGIQLPKAFRAAGWSTDIFDASDLASCRMYHGFAETWAGLAKNASEGIAAPWRIVPFTLLMLFAFVCPIFLVLANLIYHQQEGIAWLAAMLSFVPWLIVCRRFVQKEQWTPRTIALLPLSVLLFLAIQWQSLFREFRGQPANWRGRSY